MGSESKSAKPGLILSRYPDPGTVDEQLQKHIDRLNLEHYAFLDPEIAAVVANIMTLPHPDDRLRFLAALRESLCFDCGAAIAGGCGC